MWVCMGNRHIACEANNNLDNARISWSTAKQMTRLQPLHRFPVILSRQRWEYNYFIFVVRIIFKRERYKRIRTATSVWCPSTSFLPLPLLSSESQSTSWPHKFLTIFLSNWIHHKITIYVQCHYYYYYQENRNRMHIMWVGNGAKRKSRWTSGMHVVCNPINHSNSNDSFVLVMDVPCT